MATLYQIVLVSLCLFRIGYADYTLVATPRELLVGITQDIKLDCRFRGPQSSNSFDSISRLRILKENIMFNFDIVVEIQDTDSQVQNLGLDSAAVLEGYIGNATSSYIQVSWKLSTNSILGIYRCDIIGFKPNDDVLVEKTPIVSIVASESSLQNAFDLAIKNHADMEKQIQYQKDFCDKRVAAAKQNVTARLVDVNHSQNISSQALNSSYAAELYELGAKIDSLKNTGVFQYWPEGVYALLTPDSGCPNNVGAEFADGYRKFHTESTDRNYDNVSNGTHLASPTMERVDTDNFMYQHFCVSAVRSPGPAWPRGSYCINRVGGQCPSGFNSGYITWQDEVTKSKASINGRLPDGYYSANSTSIYYCCRSDGSVDAPVYLPTNKPFYLYRYNGKCQSVYEMQVSTGDMTFDTDNSNADRYENNFHPDGSVNNVNIQLCYYSL